MAEALRLADRLEGRWALHPDMQEAAAELRRLHKENELLASAADKLRMSHSEERRELLRQRDQATAQRDALLEVLEGMLRRDERNTCRHAETHRGGVLWEICDSCGAMWADDEGGKPEWEDPKEWTQARAAIKAVKEGK